MSHRDEMKEKGEMVQKSIQIIANPKTTLAAVIPFHQMKWVENMSLIKLMAKALSPFSFRHKCAWSTWPLRWLFCSLSQLINSTANGGIHCIVTEKEKNLGERKRDILSPFYRFTQDLWPCLQSSSVGNTILKTAMYHQQNHQHRLVCSSAFSFSSCYQE